MKNYFDKYFDEVAVGLKNTKVTDRVGRQIIMDTSLDILAEKANKTKENQQGLLFFCGNGASATMAEHSSHDWFQNAKVNTYTCSETAHITAISNDISFEHVFSYRIERAFGSHDILLAISSSGNSPNIIQAVNTAKNKNGFVVTMTGKDEDNEARKLGDLNFYVPLKTYGLVESAHSILLHMALDYYLDKYMGGRH